MILLSEAKEEAHRLSRVLGVDIEVAAIECPCDYSKMCGLCGASGIHYEPVYAICSHVVKETDYEGCSECEEIAERDAPIVLRAEGPALLSCAEVADAESEAA